MSIFDDMLRYLRAGFRIVPLCAPVAGVGCTHDLLGLKCEGREGKPQPGKVPLRGGRFSWHPVKDAATDEATLQTWQSLGVPMNYGLAMGARHGASPVVALDWDAYKPCYEADREDILDLVGKLPPTLRLQSGGGGWHDLYTVPPEWEGQVRQVKLRRRDGEPLASLDIRSEGGYIVGPGSLHASGRTYAEELEADTGEPCEMVTGPDLLFRALAASRPARVESAPSDGRKLEEGERGGRKLSITRLAGSMHRMGSSREAILVSCRAWLAETYRVPLAERELQRMVDSVLAKPRSGATDPSKQGLTRGPRGNIRCTLLNAATLLRQEFGERFAYDTMALRACLDGEPCEDKHLLRMRERFERDHGVAFTGDIMGQAVNLVAAEREFHPVRQYLESLKWDGTERLSHVAEKALHNTGRLEAIMVRKWLISAVARAFEPGVKADCALVLLGEQGYRKSTFFKILGGKWHGDSGINPEEKDSVLKVHAVWIYELAEIDGITSKREASAVKAFMTTSEDTIRLPYARSTGSYKRGSVFCGTTNTDDYLSDSTGARRFWTVYVSREIDRDWVAQHRDQLWAEAVHAYRAKEEHYLDRAQAREQDAEATKYSKSDPWQEVVERWLLRTGSRQVTVLDVLRDAIGFERVADIRHDHKVRVGNVMRALGWSCSQPRDRGNVTGRRRVYSAPEPPAPLPLEQLEQSPGEQTKPDCATGTQQKDWVEQSEQSEQSICSPFSKSAIGPCFSESSETDCSNRSNCSTKEKDSERLEHKWNTSPLEAGGTVPLGGDGFTETDFDDPYGEMGVRHVGDG